MKVKSESEVAQSCPTLSDPMDCSLPGSSVHEISQARVLEWGAIAFSAVPGYNGALLPILSATELQPAMDPLKPLTTCSRNHPNCIIFPLSEIQKSQSTSTLAGRSQKRANFWVIKYNFRLHKFQLRQKYIRSKLSLQEIFSAEFENRNSEGKMPPSHDRRYPITGDCDFEFNCQKDLWEKYVDLFSPRKV